MTPKLHWSAETVFGLPGLKPEMKYAIINSFGDCYCAESEPKIDNDNWICFGKSNYLPIDHDYTGDWRDSLLVRPQEIGPGDFCKLWDGPAEPEDKNATFEYIRQIGTRGFLGSRDWWWNYARKYKAPAPD